MRTGGGVALGLEGAGVTLIILKVFEVREDFLLKRIVRSLGRGFSDVRRTLAARWGQRALPV